MLFFHLFLSPSCLSFIYLFPALSGQEGNGREVVKVLYFHPFPSQHHFPFNFVFMHLFLALGDQDKDGRERIGSLGFSSFPVPSSFSFFFFFPFL